MLILEQVAAFAELKIQSKLHFWDQLFQVYNVGMQGFSVLEHGVYLLVIVGELSPWCDCNPRVRGNRREIPGLQSVAGKTLSGKELGVVF